MLNKNMFFKVEYFNKLSFKKKHKKYTLELIKAIFCLGGIENVPTKKNN